MLVESHILHAFVQDVLRAKGASTSNAQVVTDHLINANLAGHDSHGAMRLYQYITAIESGELIPDTQPQVVRALPSGGMVDGQRTFGQVAADFGTLLAIDKARETGVGAVSVRNCYHSGRIATYPLLASSHNMVGIAMANAGGGGQWVAPFGGLERRLGTNPISIAAPSNGKFPVCLDIATSTTPEGKIRDYLQRGKSVPKGWIIDSAGQTITDPQDFYDSPGAILSLGGLTSGHKGFGLSFMVDILAGALSGAGCCRPDVPTSLDGIMLLVIDVEQYSPLADFRDQVLTLVNHVKSSKPAPGFEQVLVPGEWEYRCQMDRLRDGICIPNPVWKNFVELSDRFQVELPVCR